MDESTARAIADETARSQYSGRLELLGAHKLDRDVVTSFLDDQWRQGHIPLTESRFQMVASHFKARPCRARWVVSYLAFDAAPGKRLSVARVTVDDETGAAKFELEGRP